MQFSFISLFSMLVEGVECGGRKVEEIKIATPCLCFSIASFERAKYNEIWLFCCEI